MSAAASTWTCRSASGISTWARTTTCCSSATGSIWKSWRATLPPHRRWFGLDDQRRVRADWDAGRRLRGWVARTDRIDTVLRGREGMLGRKVALPQDAPTFDFAIPDGGSLPLDGILPSIIDRRGRPRSMATIADLGARLTSFTLAHPEPAAIEAIYRGLAIMRAPMVAPGARPRYSAQIETPTGPRVLT